MYLLSIDASKITLTPVSTAARGKGRRKGAPRKEVQPAQRRIEQQELCVDHDEEFGDSDKENAEVVEDQVDMDDEEEGVEGEFEWRCRLLETIQQYPKVYDLAHPCYKDKELRYIARGMDATSKLISLNLLNIFVIQ